MYHTGLVSVSFRSLSPEEIIQAAKKAQLNWIEWGSDVHAPYYDSERLDMIAACQKAAGLRCSSYGTYFTLGKDNPEDLDNYIAAAKRLGTTTLRLWCGSKGSQDYTSEELNALYEDCRTAAATAETHGVTLCMECHNGTLTDTKESALALMETVHSPAFRMYWQPNQYRTEKENIRYLQMLKPYIDHLHVFQWVGDQKYPLADGIAIWKTYLNMLDGDRTLLLEFMPDHSPESLPIEADSLRRIIQEVN